MPTKREREYYRMGFRDAMNYALKGDVEELRAEPRYTTAFGTPISRRKPKRKLSAWNKFVKANSRKKEFRYRDGKLNLKKMGVAFRRKKRR
jgi:hypothetical protein